MPTWVLRKSVDDERVRGPFPCAHPTAIVRVRGVLTLEERVGCLLGKSEIAMEVVDGQCKIYRGHRLVGYIVVLSND